MPKYKKNYITADHFELLQKIGVDYEGFVEGVGYVYNIYVAFTPPHMDISVPLRYAPPGMDQFIIGWMQCIDSSEEIIKLSYGDKEPVGVEVREKASSGGVDGMDVANYIVSNSGTLAGGAQYGVNSMSNKQQWKYSYKASKYLKGKGVNIQTRAIKHGANGVLKNASRKITYVGGVLAVADVAIDGELRASHLLNAGMVGVSAIPVAGWIVGGGYFVADMITLGVSGQSIGQHLDAAVGAPLVNDIYDW